MILNNDTSHGAAEQWSSWLGHLAGLPGLKFLEVGSWTGVSTVWFLRNILTGEDSRITCVDTWLGGGGMPVQDNSGIMETFLKNVGPWIGRLRVMQMRSEDALAQLPAKRFDMVYIDGSHNACDVLSDSVLGWRLLKREGLMIWDDYHYHDDNPLKMPATAIDAFLKCYEGKYKQVGAQYLLCVQKL